MIVRSLIRAGIAAGLFAAAFPAMASAEGPRRVAAHEYDAARCTRQNVHTPAGKPVQTSPIVHCHATAEAAQLAKGDSRPALPTENRSARD